jgi:hypothetical protein
MDDEEKTHESEAAHIVVSGNPTTTTPHLSPYHFDAAQLFARKAGEIESKYGTSEELREAENVSISEHNSYCISAVIVSVAYLEAAVQETKIGITRRSPLFSVNDWVHEQFKSSMSDQDFRKASTPERYQLLLRWAGYDKFNKGEAPYQPVDHLSKLRNGYVHFSPERVETVDRDETGGEYGFEERLTNMFKLNPYTGSGNSFFPSQCMSFGCARWAIESSAEFTDEFFDQMNIDTDHLRTVDDLDLL